MNQIFTSLPTSKAEVDNLSIHELAKLITDLCSPEAQIEFQAGLQVNTFFSLAAMRLGTAIMASGREGSDLLSAAEDAAKVSV